MIAPPILSNRENDSLPRQLAENAPHKRATLGFLTANIHVGVSRRLWLGVVDAAERLGVNLLCFPGGVLNAPGAFESQRNALYALANPQMLDGVVNWASTIAGANTGANTGVNTSSIDSDQAANAAIALFDRFAALPSVHLTQPQAGSHTVSVDSYAGMRAVMRHLLFDHGYRRVAFVRGPSEHYYAQERFRAYCDALEEAGIAYDAALVTPHYAFLFEEGVEAVRELLDARGLRVGSDVEAIAAVSDLLALGALRALRQREVSVPHDLALVGFNDSLEARVATPPLTTVEMPFHQQGSLAVETLMRVLAGESADAVVMLQSNLVTRQSCGCRSQSIERAALGVIARPGDAALDWSRIKTLLADEVTGFDARAHELRRRQEGVVDALRLEFEKGVTGFLAALEGALNWVAEGDESVRRWQDVLSILRQEMLPALPEEERRRAEDLFGQGRVLVAEVAQRTLATRQLRDERQSAILREIGQALITLVEIEALTDVLVERLPQLGIDSCFLSLYEGSTPAGEIPLTARLELALVNGKRVAVAEESRIFAANTLVPAGLLSAERRYTMVVEPLYFRESQIGFVLFEVGPRDTSIYEVLRGYISSTLKSALLVREAMLARAVAEKADRIKTRLLANVSHELRTPLHIILEHATNLQESWTLPQELHGDVRHMQQSAEHQLRLINDLLDLSRAEIDELDLYPLLIDPHPLLSETFASLAPPNFVSTNANGTAVRWQLTLPERLPLLLADPVRLRQILLNLLANAQKHTQTGSITLGAEVATTAQRTPQLHLWVADTGAGIADDQIERIFEPFVTGDRHGAGKGEHGDHGDHGGIGLGLSITRHLVALHNGSMQVESPAAGGSIFHLWLPMPSLSQQVARTPDGAEPEMLVVSARSHLPRELLDFCRQQGLKPRHLRGDVELDALFASTVPAAIAWEMAGATSSEWRILRRLRQHPLFSTLPFVLYGESAPGADSAGLHVGLTSFVTKSTSVEALLETMRAALISQEAGAVLIVDDDPAVRERHLKVVAEALPERPVAALEDGAQAVSWMQDRLDRGEGAPSLVLLDLMMPGLEGLDVLDWMRADPRLRQVPVLVLSSRLLTLDDVRRLEHHAQVVFQNKGIFSDVELTETVHRVLADEGALPVYTSALVKHAIAFLHQNYARAISRWELAEAAGVSEDYLSRVFNREIGLSPWEYLNRYRIWHARDLLARTNDGINAVARQVGFHDQRYFARVFKKVAGVSPQEYRENVIRRT